MNELNLDGVPNAAKVQISFCDKPTCRRPHVVLFDETGQMIAHFVTPDGFDEKIVDAFCTAIKERQLA